MPSDTYQKLDIAARYMELAACLYYQDEYFAALSLAGMADEIFEDVIRYRKANGELHRIGRIENLQDDPVDPLSDLLIRAFQIVDRHYAGGARPESTYRKILNRTKNSAKHGTAPDRRSFDLTVEADPKAEAELMLSRAMLNAFVRLNLPAGPASLRFHRELIQTKNSTPKG